MATLSETMIIITTNFFPSWGLCAAFGNPAKPKGSSEAQPALASAPQNTPTRRQRKGGPRAAPHTWAPRAAAGEADP